MKSLILALLTVTACVTVNPGTSTYTVSPSGCKPTFERK